LKALALETRALDRPTRRFGDGYEIDGVGSPVEPQQIGEV
jgi:hypothetical protein